MPVSGLTGGCCGSFFSDRWLNTPSHHTFLAGKVNMAKLLTSQSRKGVMSSLGANSWGIIARDGGVSRRT